MQLHRLLRVVFQSSPLYRSLRDGRYVREYSPQWHRHSAPGRLRAVLREADQAHRRQGESDVHPDELHGKIE